MESLDLRQRPWHGSVGHLSQWFPLCYPTRPTLRLGGDPNSENRKRLVRILRRAVRIYEGLIDELRIYDYPLCQAEAAYIGHKEGSGVLELHSLGPTSMEMARWTGRISPYWLRIG